MIRFFLRFLVFLVLIAAIDGALLILSSAERPSLTSPVWQAEEALLDPAQPAALKPHLDLSMLGDHPYPIRLNEWGMRNQPVPVEKPSGAVRVAVMGGSTAFGWGVSEDEAFPARLGDWLNQFGGARYEVLNFGAPEFSSFQGVRQYEWLVHNFSPDILVLAYGREDAMLARLSDAEWNAIVEQSGADSAPAGVWGALDRFSATVRWLNTRSLKSARLALDAAVAEAASQNRWARRVSDVDLVESLSALIAHHTQRGGRTVIADMNLLNFKTRAPLRELAQRHDAVFVNLRSLFDNVGGRRERELAVEMNLEPAGIVPLEAGEPPRVTLRVNAPASASPSNAFAVLSPHPALGGGEPYQTRIHDDGTHGDERARDRVWTLETELRLDDPLTYAFTPASPDSEWDDTNNPFLNGTRNDDVYYRLPALESDATAAMRSVVHRFDTTPFDELMWNLDPSLPNAEGHAAIARRLANVIYRELASTEEAN